MPASTSSGGPGSRRHFRYGGSDLRASDAERTEVADRLSRHYQDGRLDQAEFNERLDRAMNAKTRADFSGLFADLPELPDAEQQNHPGQPAGPPIRIHRGRGPKPPLVQLATIAAVVVVAVIAAHLVMHSVVIWILIAVLAFLWLRNEEHRRRR